MPESDVLSWLRGICAGFELDIAGVFRRQGNHGWPLLATDPADLETRLQSGGHLLPLPKEPAALANIVEVAIADHIVEAADRDPDVEVTRGSERGYPDLELSGTRFDEGFYAVDIKVARRDQRNPKRTNSRITLYTGNTYFRWPQLHWPGTLRPFADYVSHLDLIVIYEFAPAINSRIASMELIVQPTWRIASRQRSSTTREYIGAVDSIEDLKAGCGEFSSPEEFYDYWRSYPFRISRQVQRQLERLISQQQQRINELEQRDRYDQGSRN